MTKAPHNPAHLPHTAGKDPGSTGPLEQLTDSHLAGQATEAPDPLLELFLQAEEEDLRQRMKAIRRAETMERHQQKKAGHLGELTATLDVPRRYWPHVHEAAIRQKIPISTERLPRHATTPVRLLTSESGALRLRLALQEVEVTG